MMTNRDRRGLHGKYAILAGLSTRPSKAVATPVKKVARTGATIACLVLAMSATNVAAAGNRPGHRNATAAFVPLQQSIDISGDTKDAAGKPIEGVRVTIAELGLEATTNADGHYKFTGLRAGRYTLAARKVGFTTPIAVTTSASGNATHNFTLVRSAMLLEPVTVTATSGPSESRLSTRSIGVLHQDELRNNASISLAHSLVALPGVRSVSTGLQIGKPMIRGLYGARVLTLEDGMRLEDYSWSEEDAPSIDARLAQRVEVIRGPASVLYGSDALGGVINVIPEALPFTASGTRVRHTSVEVFGASNNFETGGSARVDGANGRVGWRASGTGRFAGSIHTPAGEVEHTGLGAATFEGAMGYRGNASNSTLRFALYGGEFQLLEANGPESNLQSNGTRPFSALKLAQAADSDGGPVRKLLDTRVQLVHERAVGALRLEAKAQWQRHSLMEVSDDCLPDPGQPVCSATQIADSKDKPAFDLLLNTSTIDVLAHHGGSGTVHGTLGISGMYQSNDSRGPIFLVPDASISSVGAYAAEQVQAGRFTVEGSARVDHRTMNATANSQILLATDDSRSWNSATFNAGVVAQVASAVALVGNIGTGWRAPTLFDLYSNGPHLAEARYEIGDPKMHREFAFNAEAGVRASRPHLQAEVTAFQSTIDNYIYTSPTQQQMSGLPLFRHVQTDARLRGLEASAQLEVATPVTLHGRVDVVEGENTITNLPLPLIPPRRVAIGATYHVPAAAWLKHLSLHGEVEAIARQSRLDVNDLATDGYTLVNLDADAEHMFGKREVRFDLRVRNAGNAAYRDFLSRYKQFALDPGRNIALRISTGW